MLLKILSEVLFSQIVRTCKYMCVLFYSWLWLLFLFMYLPSHVLILSAYSKISDWACCGEAFVSVKHEGASMY